MHLTMHHQFPHLISVLGVNITAVIVYLSGINTVLTFISLIFAISYTTYRFYKDFTKDVDKPNENEG